MISKPIRICGRLIAKRPCPIRKSRPVTPLALPGQGAYEHVLQARQKNGNGSYSIQPHIPDRSGLERLLTE